MSRSLKALVALALSLGLGVHPALACGLEGCRLPDEYHLESRRYNTVLADEWSWMNHDLARARVARAAGDERRAEDIARWLDHAIDLRYDEMVQVRGKARVNAFRRAVHRMLPSRRELLLAHLRWRSADRDRQPPAADDPQEEGRDAVDRAEREMRRRERPSPEPREPQDPRPTPGVPDPGR